MRAIKRQSRDNDAASAFKRERKEEEEEAEQEEEEAEQEEEEAEQEEEGEKARETFPDPA